jgi:predicted  nucleic acid-binding Zn-ribbon protein
METVREKWTDERLDDLKGEVATLRTEMRDEFRAVREEMRDEFRAVRAEMRAEFRAVRDEMKTEFRAVREEIGSLRQEMHAGFDSLHRPMIQFGGIVIVALIGLIGSQLWIASQL